MMKRGTTKRERERNKSHKEQAHCSCSPSAASCPVSPSAETGTSQPIPWVFPEHEALCVESPFGLYRVGVQLPAAPCASPHWQT